MKQIIYAVVLFYALYAATAMAQGYVTMPDGQTLFTPQPRDFPAPQFYEPHGGPPVGYGVRSGDVDLYVPYGGGPTQVYQDEQ